MPAPFFGAPYRRDVDDRDPFQGLDLGLQQIHRVDRQRLVEGHVDDGGDAAGGSRGRGIGQARDSLGAPGMDLAVDHAGEYQVARGIDGLRRRRRIAHPERPDHPVADREEAAPQHAVGEHQVSVDDEIEHDSFSLSLPGQPGNNSCALLNC